MALGLVNEDEPCDDATAKDQGQGAPRFHWTYTLFCIISKLSIQVLQSELKREPRDNRGRARRCDRGRTSQACIIS